MKLIIDISDNTYEIIKNMVYFYNSQRSGREATKEILTAIKQGTPLEAIKTDVHRHKMHFYPSDYTFINTLIDKWINKGVDI